MNINLLARPLWEADFDYHIRYCIEMGWADSAAILTRLYVGRLTHRGAQ